MAESRRKKRCLTVDSSSRPQKREHQKREHQRRDHQRRVHQQGDHQRRDHQPGVHRQKALRRVNHQIRPPAKMCQQIRVQLEILRAKGQPLPLPSLPIFGRKNWTQVINPSGRCMLRRESGYGLRACHTKGTFKPRCDMPPSPPHSGATVTLLRRSPLAPGASSRLGSAVLAGFEGNGPGQRPDARRQTPDASQKKS